MSEVFISYSRKNIKFAEDLVEALDKAKRSSWKDWRDIPISEEWWREIQTGIDGADTFVFIMSPASLSSPICALEVAHAIEYDKRIIPVLYQDFEDSEILGSIASVDEKPLADKLAGRDLLEVARANLQSLKDINWLFFRDTDSFDNSFEELLRTVDTDLKHAKTHTRLLVRAREWEERGQDPSLLLTGNDLREAENWLEFNRDKDPHPHALHERYIAASADQRDRQTEDARRRRRNIQRATLVALAIVTSLALLSFGLYRTSEENLLLADNRGTDVAYQASTAQSNADLALTQAARADNNAATSDANFALAATNEANASRQAELSQSLALAAFAERAAANDDMDLAVALAVQSVAIPDPPAEAQRVLNDIVFAPGTRLRIEEPYDDDTNSSNALMYQVAFSPDGRFVLSGAAADIRLWNTESGAQIFDLGSHTDEEGRSGTPIITAAEFSQDSTRAITVGADDIRIWDIETGTEIRVIEVGFDPGTASFTHDWTHVLLGSSGGDVEYRNLESNEVLWRVENIGSGQIWSSAINPDETLGATGDLGNSVIVWDLRSGEIIHQFEGNDSLSRTPEQIAQVEFSQDGTKLFVTSREGYFFTFSVETGELVEELDISIGVQSSSLSSDQNVLAVTYTDRSIRLWDLSNGVELNRYAGHTGTVWDVEFDSDSSMLASASWDGTVRVWDLARQGVINEYRGHVAQITDLSFSSDGDRFISTSFDGSARVWDTQSGHILQRIKLFDADNLISANFSRNGAMSAINSGTSLTVFDTNTWHELMSPIELPNTIITNFFSFDDTTLFIGGMDRGRQDSGTSHAYVHQWDIDSGELLHRFSHLGVETAAFTAGLSADGRLLITPFMHLNVPTHMMAAITIWDLGGNFQYRNIPQITEDDLLVFLAVSPDNRYIAYSTLSSLVRVRELASGNLVAEFSASEPVFNVLFADQGESLLTASADGNVRLWNIASGQELRRILVDSDTGVRGLAISPDLSSILVGDNEGVIRRYFWTPTTDGILAWARANRYIRDFTCVERVTYNILPLCQNGTPIPNATVITTREIPTRAVPSLLIEEGIGQTLITTTPSSFYEGAATAQLCPQVVVEGETEGQPTIWSFNAGQGDSITISMESEDIDSYLIVKNASRDIVAVNDDASPFLNTASIQNLTFEDEGEYFIIADKYGINTNDVGAYTVSVQLLRANGECLTTVEPTERALLGLSLDRSNRNEPLRISSLIQGSNGHRAGLQVYDDIIAIDGHSVIGITDRAARDLYRLPVNSQVVLTVLRDGQLVDFLVDLPSTPQADYTEPVISRIRLGERLYGSLNPGEEQIWAFEAQQGQVVSLYLEGNGRQNSIELFTPSGEPLAQEVDLGESIDTLWYSTSIVPQVVLTEDGTYTVRVMSNARAQGYEGYFLILNELGDNGELPQQSSERDRLSPLVGQTWQLEAVRGQILNLQLLQRDSLIDAYMILLDPEGNIVGYNLDFGFVYPDGSDYDPTSHLRLEIRDFVMPATGTYTLIVNPHIHFSPLPEHLWGSYTVEYTLNSVDPVARLTIGEAERSNLPVGATDYWVVQLEAGQTVRIAVDADNPVIFANTPNISRRQAIEQGYFDTYFELYSPQSALVAENDNGPDEETTNARIDSYTAEVSGNYVIAVRSGLNRMTGGEYTISITEIEPSNP